MPDLRQLNILTCSYSWRQIKNGTALAPVPSTTCPDAMVTPLKTPPPLVSINFDPSEVEIIPPPALPPFMRKNWPPVAASSRTVSVPPDGKGSSETILFTESVPEACVMTTFPGTLITTSSPGWGTWPPPSFHPHPRPHAGRDSARSPSRAAAGSPEILHRKINARLRPHKLDSHFPPP